MNHIKVSIVVPVYNAVNYLEECLSSIICQTLKEIEIICVNDGSTDKSAEIIEEYRNKDSRIKLIDKKNSGYGDSMNAGMAVSQGKYIGIVESDDYIAEDMFEKLYLAAEKSEADFVKSNYMCFWREGEERVFEEVRLFQDKGKYNRVLGQEDFKKEYIPFFCCWIAHWSGIYRMDFLKRHQILFNITPGASYQDVGFFVQTLIYAEKIYLLEDFFYRYRQDNENSSIFNKGKAECIFDEHDFVYKCLCSDRKKYKDYIYIFQLIKLAQYRFAFNRIASEYKLNFIKRVKKEYELSIQKKELNWSYFNTWDVEEIQNILNSPEKYVENTLVKNNKLYQQIKKYSRIIIYGAGNKGGEVLERLREYITNFESVCFAVSDQDYPYKTKRGIDILCIENLTDRIKTDAVILAVTDTYKIPMLNNLIRLGFEYIIQID